MSWIAGSLLVLAVALATGFAWYERTHPTARMLALIAALAGLAALGRIAFAPLPNVKPTTDIVLIAGYALGGAPGFAVGAVAALASNLFFGQGPWTPWQMAGWGLVGLGGAALAAMTGRRLGRWGLAAACGVAGLAFGAVMNTYLWVTFSGGDHSLARLGAYAATSLPFDLAHVAGNVAFCLAFGPALVAALRRFRTRMEITWVPLPAGAGAGAAAALALVAVLVAAGPVASASAAAPKKPVRYLLDAQNRDGGFGPEPQARSTLMHSSWAALGLAAAGRNPLDVRSGGRSLLGHITTRAREVSDLGEVTRTILVLAAAGRNPRAFAGRDLVARLLRKRRRDGSWARRVNTTSFAVLALRAAGKGRKSRPVRAGARWIARQANDDGGFNFAGRGGGSGIDDTSAAVQALVAAGRRKTRTVKRAVRFLLRRQNRDGGFPLAPGAASNAQSTAWAVQAFVAAGRNPARVRRGGARSPIAYLKSLTEPGGAVRYSRTSRQTPVWVTAQAVAALARKPFPLRRVPRRARAAQAPAAAGEPAATPSPPSSPAPRSTPQVTPHATPAPVARRTKATAPSAGAPAAPVRLVMEWARAAGALTFVLL